ncbi:Crp/Fnr family transcriptional regulator [Shewanella sp. UCD-KL12]|uniref:Crp/Fnr family transcriptional regulator n=1 Tax=Shewanella sp. UCD-KL12 TaxID=1917163 RepID=UPI000970CEE5|nr:Crp/Fnr family transcriptional regulator [Shewanella sp. UCD-KL12]
MQQNHFSAAYDSLRYFLIQQGLSEAQVNAAQTHLTPIQLNSGDLLLRQGDKQSQVFFIVSGILKACHYTHSGNVFSKEFYFEHELCLLFCSWLTQAPAHYQIESIEDSVVIPLPLFLLSQADWQPVKISLLSQQLIYKEEKEEFFLLNTPEQRYLHLLNHRPMWVDKLNNIQLASYIGISPVSLSRLKSRLAI